MPIAPAPFRVGGRDRVEGRETGLDQQSQLLVDVGQRPGGIHADAVGPRRDRTPAAHASWVTARCSTPDLGRASPMTNRVASRMVPAARHEARAVRPRRCRPGRRWTRGRGPRPKSGTPACSPTEQRGVRDHVHSGLHHLARPAGKRVAWAQTSMPCRCASRTSGFSTGAETAAYTLIAVAPVPRASATTCRQSCGRDLRRHGAEPRSRPAMRQHPGIGEELGSRGERGVVDRRDSMSPTRPPAPARRAPGRRPPCRAPW